MCRDMEDMRHGVYFWGNREGNAALSPPLSSASMAPCGVVGGQVGRWFPDTLWHVKSGLDIIHFVGEGLTWRHGRDANGYFFPRFLGGVLKRLAGEDYLSIQRCQTGLREPSLGALIDVWLTDIYDWTGRVHANQLTREKSTRESYCFYWLNMKAASVNKSIKHAFSCFALISKSPETVIFRKLSAQSRSHLLLMNAINSQIASHRTMWERLVFRGSMSAVWGCTDSCHQSGTCHSLWGFPPVYSNNIVSLWYLKQTNIKVTQVCIQILTLSEYK